MATKPTKTDQLKEIPTNQFFTGKFMKKIRPEKKRGKIRLHTETNNVWPGFESRDLGCKDNGITFSPKAKKNLEFVIIQ